MSICETEDSIDSITSLTEMCSLMDKSIKDYNEKSHNSEYSTKRKGRKAESEDCKRKFDTLQANIKKKEETITSLENENAILKAEIQRCEAKIKAYPQMKQRYDQLSKSLSKAHMLQNQANHY